MVENQAWRMKETISRIFAKLSVTQANKLIHDKLVVLILNNLVSITSLPQDKKEYKN